MIRGKFDEVGRILFEIELVASNASKLLVEAMLDTGFTGFLAINKQDIDGFGWVFNGNELMITPQGQVRLEKYLGKVVLDGQEYELPVYAGDNITEILLGSLWLKILPLTINYQAGILTLGD
jgi:predicted aspartyl protease